MRQADILLMILFLLFASGTCYASSLEDAKQVIDDNYRYSMDKDVDSYILLYDEEYLNDIYGEDHKELFQELFNYFEIKDYNIDYQYYTESDQSMTVFFNLKSTAVIDGEEMDMDNDMVAFFTVTETPKLRYIMLQEEFIGQMNKEFVYNTAISRIASKQPDLKEEAEAEGVELEDYESFFKEKIAEHEARHSSGNLLWVFLVIALMSSIYIFAVKNDIISQHIKDEKAKSHYLEIRETTMIYVDRAYVMLKEAIIRALRMMVSLSMRAYKEIKARSRK